MTDHLDALTAIARRALKRGDYASHRAVMEIVAHERLVADLDGTPDCDRDDAHPLAECGVAPMPTPDLLVSVGVGALAGAVVALFLLGV